MICVRGIVGWVMIVLRLWGFALLECSKLRKKRNPILQLQQPNVQRHPRTCPIASWPRGHYAPMHSADLRYWTPHTPTVNPILSVDGRPPRWSPGPGRAHEEPFYRSPNPVLVTSPKLEKSLLKSGISPIGSRRRRAALQNSQISRLNSYRTNVSRKPGRFCLLTGRRSWKELRGKERIAKLRKAPAEEAGGERPKQSRLKTFENDLERLKILADVNDPLVKKGFEDGQGK